MKHSMATSELITRRELETADTSCGQSQNTLTCLTTPWNSDSERQPPCSSTGENAEGLTSCRPHKVEELGMEYKEETVEMMDKDELDELLGLQVQFGESQASPVVASEEVPVKEESRPCSCPKRKPHLTRQCFQVDIGGEAFKMWLGVGAAQGLHSDPDIAAFLLQHYESTKNILFPSHKCRVCSQPLSLFCSKCNHPGPFQSSSSVSDSQSTLKKKEQTALEMPSQNAKVLSEKMVPFTVKKKKNKKRGEKAKDVSASVVECVPLNGDSDGGDIDVMDKQDGSKNLNTKIEEEKVGEPVGDSTSSVPPVRVAKPLGNMNTKQDRMLNSKQPRGVVVAREGKVFRCKVCSHSYTRACSLKAHMRKHTGERPFKCTRCEAAFSLSGSLIVHHRTHTGNKPFVCEECGHSFSISNALKQHRRQHTGEKPYHCNICFSKYSRSDSLKVHMRTHSGDRPFICEECGANFSRLYCLIAHKKKHSGERPFKCMECQATFMQSGKLTIHMRKHTGDRPFQCEQCGASFTQSDRLKTHLRIHSGEKPYKCGECGKGFSHPHSLKVHGRVHTGDRPYKCDICSLTFADPSYFRRHKTKHATPKESNVGAAVNASAPDSLTGGFQNPMSSADEFAVPISSQDNFATLQSASIAIPASSVPPMIPAGFPVTNAATETTGNQDCFSETSTGFSVPQSSSVPSLGFSIPSSTGLGFSMPAASTMNVITDGSDAVSNINAADPFAFLRTALHCPGSYQQ